MIRAIRGIIHENFKAKEAQQLFEQVKAERA
jgi:hypothetical protein